jgi:hypothetical protein
VTFRDFYSERRGDSSESPLPFFVPFLCHFFTKTYGNRQNLQNGQNYGKCWPDLVSAVLRVIAEDGKNDTIAF